MSDRYTKKPVTIQAMQYTGSNNQAVSQWADAFGPGCLITRTGDTLSIFTPEGTMTVDPGDWVIQGVKGEFYPCKPDIFELTYEPAISIPGVARSATVDALQVDA